MQVQYNEKNHTYFIKEKLSNNQTLLLGFERFDKTYDTNSWNVYLSVYSKRKDKDKNENNHVVTGKKPIETLMTGMRAFNLLEQDVLNNNHTRINIIYCFWTDKRRKTAYYHFLRKHGYHWGTWNGYQCIMKKVLPFTVEEK